MENEMGSRRKPVSIIFLTNIALEITFVSSMVCGPTFQRVFGLSKTELGICLGAVHVGMILFAPFVGNITNRIGAVKVTVIGLTGVLLSAGIVIASMGMVMLLPGLALFGLSAALIANGNATMTAELYPEQLRRIMALASALWFSSSAISSPGIGAWLEFARVRGLDSFSFRVPYGFNFLFIGLCLVLITGIVAPYIKKTTKAVASGEGAKNGTVEDQAAERNGPAADERVSESGTPKRAFEKKPLKEWIWIPCMAGLHGLFLVTLMSWVNPMVQEKFAVNEFQGSLALAVMAVGIGSGRFSLSFIRTRVDDRIILTGSGFLGGIVMALALSSSSFLVMLIALGITGFIGCATLPCILSLIGSKFPADKSRIYGFMESSIASMGLLGPTLVGALGDAGVPVWTALSVCPIAGGMMATVSFLWLHREKGGKVSG